MTPAERERDEELRMEQLWIRLAKAADEIRDIIKVKEGLRHE